LDSVIRAALTYVFLLILTRVSGRRTLGEMTAFDLVLTLIISECVQDALTDTDHSFTNGMLLVVTLIGTDILLSYIKHKNKTVSKWLDGTPVVLVRAGKMERTKMDRHRIDEDDILESARENHGLASMKEIEHAVLEPSGEISIVPAHS
jgi:uncharacterized membrane protein YcaP (DUF421 family)